VAHRVKSHDDGGPHNKEPKIKRERMRTAIHSLLELTSFCVVSYFLLRPEEGGEVGNQVGIVDQEIINEPKPSTQTSRSVVADLPKCGFLPTFPVPHTVHSSVELQARGHIFYTR